MKNLWNKIRYREWFTIALQVLFIVIAFVVLSAIGILINVWFVYLMKNTFGINVYWTLH